MKKISIIVPVYKVEKYIDICINSLVNQTYENLEIILVDDESPDNCPAICDEWAKKDERVKVIHKQNGGVSDARNVGLKEASGDYIGFVDSDDVVSVDMYKTLIELVKENNADVSICQYDEFMDGKEPLYTYDNKYHVLDSNDTLKELFCKNTVANVVWNKIYKRELFNDIKFPIEINCGEDLYVTHKLIIKSKKIVITSSKLYGYMVNRKDSIMNSYSINCVDDVIKASNSRYNDLKDNKEILNYLIGSRPRTIYNIHTWATEKKDKELFYSEKLLNEYKILRKVVNIKSFLCYLSGGNYKIKILRIILLINRKLFWKIRTRERK